MLMSGQCLAWRRWQWRRCDGGDVWWEGAPCHPPVLSFWPCEAATHMQSEHMQRHVQCTSTGSPGWHAHIYA